ncbi:tRNA (guanine(26)-N(2))-dimethyltransferase isoform X2 [Prorops nasuta]
MSASENVENIREGEAEILVRNKNVFYNPVQEFNRDLSISVLSLFSKERHKYLNAKENKKINSLETFKEQEGITILDALAATGLRSIRYAKEIPDIKQIIANDISAKAVESMKENILHNNVEQLVTPSHEDATMLMYQHRKDRFDAIDLDPYGCPSVFLDGAVQSVSNGGILLVTATDMAVLAGNSPETCFVKYGSVALKSKACHEIALRILLYSISSHAARYGRYIKPLLSISVDFYVRVFVQVFTSQLKCKENSSKSGMIFKCTGCESLNFQPLGQPKATNGFKLPIAPSVDQLCKHCQHRHQIGGPVWLGPLHDQEFLSQLLQTVEIKKFNTSKRILGVLSMISEELDQPLYYTLDRLMSIVKCDTMPIMTFRSALLNAGYQVSYSHANKISIKTNAPNYVIWDIVRAWEKEHPAKRDKLPESSPAYRILNDKSATEISFKTNSAANPVSRLQHLTRFQSNPTENWGPAVRSKTRIDMHNEESKKERNQNKKLKRQRLESSEDRPVTI